MINCIVVTDPIFSCQSNPQAERFTFGSDDMRSGRHGYGYGRDGGYRASSARQGYDYGRGYGEYRGYGEDRGYGDDRGYGEDRGYGVGFRGYGHHNGPMAPVRDMVKMEDMVDTIAISLNRTIHPW